MTPKTKKTFARRKSYSYCCPGLAFCVLVVFLPVLLAPGAGSGKLRNLLKNPDFEEPAGPSRPGVPKDWTIANSLDLAVFQDQAVAHGNRFSLKFSAIVPRNNLSGRASQAVKDICPNSRYVFSGWVKAQDLKKWDNPGYIFFVMEFLDAAQQRVEYCEGCLLAAKAWQRFSLPGTAPTNAASCLVACAWMGGNTSGSIWFDDLELAEDQAPAENKK